MADKDKFGSIQKPVRPSAAASLSARFHQDEPVTENITGNTNVNNNTTTNTVHIKKQPKRERKEILMTLRIKPSVKAAIEDMRKFYGYSQSDFVEVMVSIVSDIAKRDGWKPK